MSIDLALCYILPEVVVRQYMGNITCLIYISTNYVHYVIDPYSRLQELSIHFTFFVVSSWLIFSISFRVASLALGQSYDCPSASEATLKNMFESNVQIKKEIIINLKKPKHNTTYAYLMGCIWCCIWLSQHDIYFRGIFDTVYECQHCSVSQLCLPEAKAGSIAHIGRPIHMELVADDIAWETDICSDGGKKPPCHIVMAYGHWLGYNMD